METPPSNIDQIAALLAAPPPRRVPPELLRAATKESAPFLFVLIGGCVAAFGMLFVLGFFPWNIARQWSLDMAVTATAPGRIVEVERTGVSISKTRVMRYTFEFAPSGALERLRGTCYTTGSRWEPNADVIVRYRPDNPSIACVEGAHLSKTGWGSMFVLLILAPGVALITVGLKLRGRAKFLLTRGQVTEAFVTAIEETNTRINDHPLFRIVLKRVDRPDDPPLIVRRFQPPIVAFARDRLESKLPVFVLFDPKQPKRALLPETL